MNKLKNILFLTSSLILVNCKAKIIDEQKNRIFSTYDSSWYFFNLEDTINVKILNHLKNEFFCGIVTLASVSIVVDDKGNVFRVLDLCNMSDYAVNENIRLIPAEKPNFHVNLPYRFYINPITKKREQYEIDKKTLNTTYAYIEKISH